MFNWARIKGCGTRSFGLVRFALVAVLIVTLLLTGVSCGKQKTELEEPSETGRKPATTSGSGINAPQEMNYLVNNLLVTEEIEEGYGENFSYTYLTVSGLKDQVVEKKINDRIKAVYDELRVQKLPSYRGIKILVPQGSVIDAERIYAYETGNFNHILSITFHKSTSWQTVGDKGEPENERDFYETVKSISETETLNFDLNTGEEFYLTDLFCDNVDGIEILNQYMRGYLTKAGAEEENGYFEIGMGEKLVAPFKGLAASQKFAVNAEGISLVLDHQTPQFDTEQSALQVMVNFAECGDVLAVTNRFYDENSGQNIFDTNASPTKTLIWKHQEADLSGEELNEDGGLRIYRSWQYSSQLPEKIRNRLAELTQVDEHKVNQLRQRIEEMNEPDVGGTYGLSVHASQHGKYINVRRDEYGYDADQYWNSAAHYCYDGETAEELQLKDLFQADYDYQPVIVEELKAFLGNNGGKKEIAAMQTALSGFNLFSDQMTIPVNYIDKEKKIEATVLYIPYEKFGCENMVIFH